MRPTLEEDAQFVLEILNMPKWKQFIGDRNVHSLEDAAAYVRNKMMPQLERLGHSNFIMIQKSDGAKIGFCGLYDREGLEGVDVGFALLPQYEGKGFAFEGSKKVMEAGITDFGITRIKGITLPENTASQNLLERLGLKYIKHFFLEGDPDELMLYEWVKPEV